MAIPFNLPSDEQTEDNYRRLDQLLHDLYRVLRQILMRTTTHSPEQPRNSDGEGAGAEALAGAGAGDSASAPSRSRQVVDVTGSRPLPDVVSSTLSCRCQRRRPVRRHRRRRRSSCAPLESPCPSPDVSQPLSPRPQPEQPENWVVIGEHLRKIAEEFKSSLRKEEESREQQDELKMEVKTSGLFSLLVPAHFRSSLWTTVILLVGWRLLVRAR